MRRFRHGGIGRSVRTVQSLLALAKVTHGSPHAAPRISLANDIRGAVPWDFRGGCIRRTRWRAVIVMLQPATLCHNLRACAARVVCVCVCVCARAVVTALPISRPGAAAALPAPQHAAAHATRQDAQGTECQTLAKVAPAGAYHLCEPAPVESPHGEERAVPDDGTPSKRVRGGGASDGRGCGVVVRGCGVVVPRWMQVAGS